MTRIPIEKPEFLSKSQLGNHILARPVGALRICCFECAFCNVAMSAPRINNARLRMFVVDPKETFYA